VDTFFSPGKVFAQFREGPAPWLGPVLLCAALAVVVIAIRPLFISDAKMVDFMLEKMAEMGANTATPEQMQTQLGVQTIIGTVSTVAWMFMRVWLVGLLLFGVYGLMLGGNAEIRRYAAVASHAFLVGALGFALVAALQYATGRLDLTMDAALLAPGLDPRGIPARMLHAVTPWGVWTVALLALGGATLNRRRGWIGVAALLFSLQMAIALAFALITHMAAGRAAAG
jgi:hypothetical protein